MPVNPIPAGHQTVSPYLVVTGAAKLIDFLKSAFGAEELSRMARPDGAIMHAEVRIGDSIVMIGDANEMHPAQQTMLHLYVEDADAMYHRAIGAGGKVVREIATQFYGDRSGGIADPFGNQWWVSSHVEDVSLDEINRRASNMAA